MESRCFFFLWLTGYGFVCPPLFVVHGWTCWQDLDEPVAIRLHDISDGTWWFHESWGGWKCPESMIFLFQRWDM